MRKHSVRKWLHAILDLLPLFVIPIFAIYSRNENAQFGYEVTQEINKAVDFNQIAKYEILNTNGITFTINNSYVELNGTMLNVPQYSQTAFTSNIRFKRDGTKYLIKFNNTMNLNVGITGYISHSEDFIWSGTEGTIWTGRLFLYTNQIYTFNSLQVQANIYDLTQMYGAGNEPTIEEFNSMFANSYYPYTESQEVVIENYETITYNDTDIGSQMVYTLYNTVDKYFNMNNVFNMEQIWNWINNNMFGGSAPLSAYIVYQIIAYELIMDIIFLLYSVMMFIVDFAEKGIDRFMGRAC